MEVAIKGDAKKLLPLYLEIQGSKQVKKQYGF